MRKTEYRMPDPADRDPALIAALPSLTALLRHRAATRPDDRAYVALSDRGGEGSAITFAELDRRAAALAARIAKGAEPGARALLLFPMGIDCLVLCQLGPALPRHGADPERAASALYRRAMRADPAACLPAASVAVAARHQRLPGRSGRRAQFRVRSMCRPAAAGAACRHRPVVLEGRFCRRRAGARPHGRTLHREVPSQRVRPAGDVAGLWHGRSDAADIRGPSRRGAPYSFGEPRRSFASRGRAATRIRR